MSYSKWYNEKCDKGEKILGLTPWNTGSDGKYTILTGERICRAALDKPLDSDDEEDGPVKTDEICGHDAKATNNLRKHVSKTHENVSNALGTPKTPKGTPSKGGKPKKEDSAKTEALFKTMYLAHKEAKKAPQAPEAEVVEEEEESDRPRKKRKTPKKRAPKKKPTGKKGTGSNTGTQTGKGKGRRAPSPPISISDGEDSETEGSEFPESGLPELDDDLDVPDVKDDSDLCHFPIFVNGKPNFTVAKKIAEAWGYKVPCANSSCRRSCTYTTHCHNFGKIFKFDKDGNTIKKHYSQTQYEKAAAGDKSVY